MGLKCINEHIFGKPIPSEITKHFHPPQSKNYKNLFRSKFTKITETIVINSTDNLLNELLTSIKLRVITFYFLPLPSTYFLPLLFCVSRSFCPSLSWILFTPSRLRHALRHPSLAPLICACYKYTSPSRNFHPEDGFQINLKHVGQAILLFLLAASLVM